MQYGVPLSVPFAGRLLAWALRAWHGCEAPSARTIGALRLDAPPSFITTAHPIACAMLASAGTGGARWPVSVSATVRMQTPARDAGSAVPLAAGPGPSSGPGAPSGTSQDPGPARGPDGSPGIVVAPSPPIGTPSWTAAGEVPAAGAASSRPTPSSGGLRGEPTPPDPAFCSSSVPGASR
jgi:hypothetical protein